MKGRLPRPCALHMPGGARSRDRPDTVMPETRRSRRPRDAAAALSCRNSVPSADGPALTHPGNTETTGARMEHTNTQPCGQTDVRDAFRLEAVRDDAGRKALFARMCREGLTGCAMYAWAHPREDDWLRLVSAPGRLLLQATVRPWPPGCSAPGGGRSGNSTSRSSARLFHWPCRWPAPPSAGSSDIRRPVRSGACARSATAMSGVRPRPADSSSRGACPTHAGWPGAASMWTASSCSAHPKHWPAP